MKENCQPRNQEAPKDNPAPDAFMLYENSIPVSIDKPYYCVDTWPGLRKSTWSQLLSGRSLQGRAANSADQASRRPVSIEEQVV
jgi:hypothetical protein